MNARRWTPVGWIQGRRQAEDAWRRWWTAETSGAVNAAEQALHELVGLLPSFRPRRGFAERVLAEAGIAAAPAPWRRWIPALPSFSGWRSRALVAVCLVLAAWTVALLPALALVVRVEPGEAVASAVGVFVTAVEHLPVVVTVGKVLVALGEALYRAATSPPVLACGLAALAFSTAALRGLAQLLAPERMSAHVLPVR